MSKEIFNKIIEFDTYPCVSIIMKTHRTAPDYHKDPLRLKNLVKEAIDRLSDDFSKKDMAAIVNNIEDLVASIDFSKNMDGLALYANDTFKEKILLPFAVKDRVVVDNTFATRDLIRWINRDTNYYVLLLNQNNVRLYDGHREQLNEIIGHGFPLENDHYITDSLVASFSNESERKIKDYFNTIDKLFLEVHKNKPGYLLLTGAKKNLAYYKDVCDKKDVIIGFLEGNYERVSLHELGKAAWPIVKNELAVKRHVILDDLKKAVSQNKYASGVQEVWRVANEGRCSVLVVEEDYRESASIKPKDNTLRIESDSKLSGVIDDVVDEIAEIVIKKGGRVVFTENGTLDKHQKIAAILRY